MVKTVLMIRQGGAEEGWLEQMRMRWNMARSAHRKSYERAEPTTKAYTSRYGHAIREAFSPTARAKYGVTRC